MGRTSTHSLKRDAERLTIVADVSRPHSRNGYITPVLIRSLLERLLILDLYFQRLHLFLTNALRRESGAYFAHHERINLQTGSQETAEIYI